MPTVPSRRKSRSALIAKHLSARSTPTPFASLGLGASPSAYDGGLGSTWVVEGPYSLTTCTVPDADGSERPNAPEPWDELFVLRRFLCTPFGTVVLEPAERFDGWFECADWARFDAMTSARDFSPLPLRPFMRDFDAAPVGAAMARFFRRLHAKQEAMTTVHGSTPILAKIPYGLREAVLHACAHDRTGKLVGLADEQPKALVALAACIGDRPDLWVTAGPLGPRLAAPLERLVAGAPAMTCLREALESLAGTPVDPKAADDLHRLSHFVTSSAPDYTWLAARALAGVDVTGAPTVVSAATWAAWLRTLRPA